MTTNSEPSSARDQLSVRRGPVVERAGRSQSAAVQGANHAFTARGNKQEHRALYDSTYGARTAAASAGYVSRQKAVSPPKNSSISSTALLGSQSAQISQVQRLVKGFEQTSTGDELQLPSSVRGVFSRGTSRSPSQVAARIASNNAFSPPRALLPSRNQGKDINTIPDTEVSPPNYEIIEPKSGYPSNSTESTQSSDHEATITRQQRLRRVSSAQRLPSALPLEQNRTNDKNTSSESLQKRLLQGASSTLAAQAAVRNSAPLNLSSVSEPSRTLSKGVPFSEDAPLEDSGRGRSSTARTRTSENQVVPRKASRSSILDAPCPTTEELDSSRERPGRNVSKPKAFVRLPSAQSSQRFPSVSNAQYVDERTGLTEVSLADAIVASSLASSRAPSPAKKVPAPPPPRRSSLSRALFRHRHSSDTDLPCHGGPYQGMRQTLRKHDSDGSDDEKDRRSHKHFMKHPNKHREGSRQRWKDKVAERERKRYEGVWAANKGLFLTNPDMLPSDEVTPETSASEMVLDLVVRDIWSRSRLPTDTLAEIWDLVDREGIGTLTRDGFVLGLWLIDQRLKGRKLPIRVSPTLWASVRHAWGVRIPRRL